MEKRATPIERAYIAGKKYTIGMSSTQTLYVRHVIHSTESMYMELFSLFECSETKAYAHERQNRSATASFKVVGVRKRVAL